MVGSLFEVRSSLQSAIYNLLHAFYPAAEGISYKNVKLCFSSSFLLLSLDVNDYTSMPGATETS